MLQKSVTHVTEMSQKSVTHVTDRRLRLEIVEKLTVRALEK